MTKDFFEELVVEALENLPKEFADKLSNVDVVIEDEPTPLQHRKMNLRPNMTLFGLYEGIPQLRRGGNYGVGMVIPDKITIFQKPIEAWSRSDEEIKERVRRTVLHEIGHHFGLSDLELKKTRNG